MEKREEDYVRYMMEKETGEGRKEEVRRKDQEQKNR